jgi:hypothetical protein
MYEESQPHCWMSHPLILVNAMRSSSPCRSINHPAPIWSSLKSRMVCVSNAPLCEMLLYPTRYQQVSDSRQVASGLRVVLTEALHDSSVSSPLTLAIEVCISSNYGKQPFLESITTCKKIKFCLLADHEGCQARSRRLRNAMVRLSGEFHAYDWLRSFRSGVNLCGASSIDRHSL